MIVETTNACFNHFVDKINVMMDLRYVDGVLAILYSYYHCLCVYLVVELFQFFICDAFNCAARLILKFRGRTQNSVVLIIIEIS